MSAEAAFDSRWQIAHVRASHLPACLFPCPCLQNALDNVSNKVGVSGAAQDEKDASQLDPFRCAGRLHLRTGVTAG